MQPHFILHAVLILQPHRCFVLLALSNLLAALFPIFLTFALGFLLGKKMNAAQVRFASYGITPVMWGILWVIGVKSGEVLSHFAQGVAVLKTAAVYAGSTSAAVFFSLWALNKPQQPSTTTSVWAALWPPLKECLIAFGLVALGVFCHRFGWQHTGFGAMLLDVSYWLYALLILIGMELAKVHINRSWLSPRVLLIPLTVITASLLAGMAISVVTGERLATSLALSSGFGWFSLSGALAGEHLGDAYAGIALLTDLFRELLGIATVFLLGNRFAVSSIGVCGATAASTTLPFVRRAYAYEYVPIALVSGLVLTITAPFFMLIFMSI